jgi:hypothetical protein
LSLGPVFVPLLLPVYRVSAGNVLSIVFCLDSWPLVLDANVFWLYIKVSLYLWFV